MSAILALELTACHPTSWPMRARDAARSIGLGRAIRGASASGGMTPADAAPASR
jgi:hypothetical protein